ncbi:GCN5-related N-acetyltransferase [hydrothermal vent metagenome]|uniref:GCN5-related N-acetyltransferase n=1 Tax=hydrothermal vent metagenome TaxID=652676 RepID=A0A3B0SUA0_9ZZZZ
MTETLHIRPARDDDEAGLIKLWTDCGLVRPWNSPGKDIAFARRNSESDVLVGEAAGEMLASVMVGHDGHRGIVYYVSVDPSCQGKGYGHQIMAAAEEWLRERDVWKLNLLIREGNEKVQAFYESLGYEVEPRLCMARKLID